MSYRFRRFQKDLPKKSNFHQFYKNSLENSLKPWLYQLSQKFSFFVSKSSVKKQKLVKFLESQKFVENVPIYSPKAR